MKKIIYFVLLLSISVIGQNNKELWTKVVGFEKVGKPKSANEIVEKIYLEAKSNKNEVEIIRCFFYRSKFLQTVDENAQTKILYNLENEIKQVSIPSKAILNLVYAKCLNSYYNRQKYNIQQRIKTDSISTNILSWSTSNFEEKIDISLLNTLENETVLKSISLLAYEPVFEYFELEEFKKQTLFEYLLKENIEFYKSKLQLYSYNPKDFMDYENYFYGNSDTFIKGNFDLIADKNLLRVVDFYQQLEKNNPTIENKFERIQFFNEYVLKSSLQFLIPLNAIQKETTDDDLIQKIQLKKALIYSQNAEKIKNIDFNNKSISILDSIIKTKNSTNSYGSAIREKQRIESKFLNIELQKFIYPNENSRAFINYKNIDDLKISFFRIDKKIQNPKSIENLNFIEKVLKTKATKISTYKLQNKRDYFQYSTEVLLPNLDLGNYLVHFESSNNENDTKTNDFEIISVTNFSVLASSKKNTDIYQVLDRKTGFPIENVTIKSEHFNLKTNKSGIVEFKKNPKKSYENLSLELFKDHDSVKIQSSYYLSNFEDSNNDYDEKHRAKVELFLDRAIYRPGQTVFYKGIVIQKKNKKSSVVSNLTLKIEIDDASYNTFKEFEVKTNEFGSFFGEFVLPKSGLTGDFRMKVDEPDDVEKDKKYNKIKDEHPFWDNVDFQDGYVSFKVEEYKRPKFEVTFDAVKEKFVVDQKVSVNGKAKAFSGSSISDSKVSYTISRETYNSYKRYDYATPEILETGETKTDATGKFKIDFIAKPNVNSVKENLPLFKYLVKATVTDINGETHESQMSILVGYHELALKIKTANVLETKNKNFISFTSTNLNGEFVSTKGELRLYFIKGFSKKFKSRVFQKPETTSISDDDFNVLFPYENNEKQVVDANGTLVFSKSIDTKIDKEVELDFISDYKSGYYRIVFSATDSLNNNIETENRFQIIQSKNPTQDNKIITIDQINEDAKKDGFVLLKINSVLPNVYCSVFAKSINTVFYEKDISLNSNETFLKIPLEKDFENSVKIGFQGVFENTNFTEQKDVLLKSETSKLQIETVSFRNKIEPGGKENWSFKINAKNTNSESEILASMYDSSLDQFKKDYWRDLDYSSHNSTYLNFKTSLGFGNERHSFNFNRDELYFNFKNEATKLMEFGFDFSYIKALINNQNYFNTMSEKDRTPNDPKFCHGKVSDASGPLPGANVVIKGTKRAVSTDFDGYYQIEAKPGDILLFSFIGKESRTAYVGSSRIYNALLTETGELKTVVVTGALGIRKMKSSVTSSQIMVLSKNENNGESVLQSLAGKVSGLQISTTNSGVNSNTKIVLRGLRSITGNNEALVVIDGVISSANDLSQLPADVVISINVIKGQEGAALYGEQGANGVIIVTTQKSILELTKVKPRKNLSETAFFFPDLKTDSDGKISVNFTSPEALTEWKFRMLAHNKDAVSGYLEKSVVTQKDIMATPNFPRFFREKDTITIVTKIANVTNETKTGVAVLQLFDASTMETIDSKSLNLDTVKNFTIPPMGNVSVSWKIYIPEGIQGIDYKVLAKSGDFSDGEENILPVLTNNMLVTESIPIWVKGDSKKEYTFNNLKNNTSSTLKNHQLTFEYTSNPTWLAIKSIPYLMEYEHECAEQTFARFYANALATEIISSNPKIATVFENWRKDGKLISKLEENSELKSIILAETPWLKDAEDEDQQKKNLALLFDLEKMERSQETVFEKLKQKQKSSGGFAWFDGGSESEYITRHIIAGFGHLKNLRIKSISKNEIDEISKSGIAFLDNKFLENNKMLKKNAKAKNLKSWKNESLDLHYLYARSFFLDDYKPSETLKSVIKEHLENAKSTWLNFSLYDKGLIALSLNRFGDNKTAKLIVESLKETASNNEDWGMYWIENKAGYNWNQAPIETQALLIEAFSEINDDTKSIDAMKVWLLKNKQAKNWPTTKSTTEAIYALMLKGSDWMNVKDNTIINIGDEKILTKKLSENEKEAETGYLKLTWKKEEIKKEMAEISIQNKSIVPGFGGVFWQYFEDLDQIKTNSGASLLVEKELFLKITSDKGTELQKISNNTLLRTGDLVTVRLLVSAKETMEFVHLKDMRASCFEPVNALSEYKYNQGIGYYMSTKDAATHLFFDVVNKGTYVFEYDIRVNNSGNFSNGITTIESMYAPEFSSHTKGIRVNVK